MDKKNVKLKMHIILPNDHNPDKLISIMKPMIIEPKWCEVCLLCVVTPPFMYVCVEEENMCFKHSSSLASHIARYLVSR